MDWLSRFLFWYLKCPIANNGGISCRAAHGEKIKIGTRFGAPRSGKPSGKSTGIPEENP